MLIFNIEIEQTELEEGIDSYTRGHITIQGKHRIISSKEMRNNQSMMIFISISELLDGIRIFLINPKKKIYHFLGVGCSFQFIIVKQALNKFKITNLTSEIIDEITQFELIQAIWQEVKTFILKYGNFLDEKEIVKNDLTYSIEEFKEQFNLSN